MDGPTRNDLGDLTARIAAGSPRIVSVWGPPGYDKTVLLRRFAASCSLALYDLTGKRRSAGLADGILRALLSRDAARAARAAADRLARGRDDTDFITRETLRREWPAEHGPEMFVVRDVAGVLSTTAGAELLAELIATLPATRTLAVLTRSPLPPALQQQIRAVPSASVGPDDLALRLADVLDAVRSDAVPRGVIESIWETAAGWPLVVRMLVALAEDDKSLRGPELRTLSHEKLFAYAAHRTIANLDDLVRASLVVAALMDGVAQPQLIRILGDRYDDLQFARLLGLPIVENYGDDRARVHPEMLNLLHERFEPLVKSCFERVIQAFSGDGAYAEAAALSLEQEDVARAAAILDASPPYTAARIPLAQYERILDSLDRDLIIRFPNLWLATIPFRAFSVDRATYLREAETIYYCLPQMAGAAQRAAVLMHLASAYANLGRSGDGERVLTEALKGYGREPIPARATLLRFSAMLRGIEGRFSVARVLVTEAATIEDADEWHENQTLHYIEAHEAAFSADYSRGRVIFDELIRRETREGLPLYVAYAATNGAFLAWVNDDDPSFHRYIGILEEALTPGLRRGFTPMIDAARGRVLELDEDYRWPVIAAMAHLYRMAEASTHEEALDAARAAARAADIRADPFIQICAHSAVYMLDETARADEARIVGSIAATVESDALRSAVELVIRGEPAGMLEPFIRGRVLRLRRREPRLTVELLAGRVTRDGVAVKLSDKEFELLALLAVSNGAVSRDRVGAALWDHLDPEEWPNNLKVTVSRLRSKLGERDSVTSEPGGYRLSPAIEVDLRWAEAYVREHERRELDGAARAMLRGIVDAYRAGTHARYERFGWMHSSTVRMHGVVCTAGLTLARDALRRGELQDVLLEARIVSEIEALSEEACELTMRALLARDEPDAARREYRRYATALAAELDATPPRRLTELARAVAAPAG
jgi:DNA-binding SARP family transcriptional activator